MLAFLAMNLCTSKVWATNSDVIGIGKIVYKSNPKDGRIYTIIFGSKDLDEIYVSQTEDDPSPRLIYQGKISHIELGENDSRAFGDLPSRRRTYIDWAGKNVNINLVDEKYRVKIENGEVLKTIRPPGYYDGVGGFGWPPEVINVNGEVYVIAYERTSEFFGVYVFRPRDEKVVKLPKYTGYGLRIFDGNKLYTSNTYHSDIPVKKSLVYDFHHFDSDAKTHLVPETQLDYVTRKFSLDTPNSFPKTDAQKWRTVAEAMAKFEQSLEPRNNGRRLRLSDNSLSVTDPDQSIEESTVNSNPTFQRDQSHTATQVENTNGSATYQRAPFSESAQREAGVQAGAWERTSSDIKLSHLLVADDRGNEVSPWKIVKQFSTILNETNLGKYIESDTQQRAVIDRVFSNLIKKEIGNAAILGPPGVGKTELIKQLVREVKAGKAPAEIANKVFLMIDIGALQAGTFYHGQFETKVNALIALCRQFNIVLVVDEAHSLKGAGVSEGSPSDIWQMLKPGLQEGFLKIIGMSTVSEWERAYLSDPAVQRRFGKPIVLAEPSEEFLLARFEAFTKRHEFPKIEMAELKAILAYSNKFDALGAQPSKGILLIEEIFAYQKIKLGTTQKPNLADVQAAAQRLYGLHESYFDRRKMGELLSQLPQALGEKVIGQKGAKAALQSSFTNSIFGLDDPEKSKGRKIFVGPAGQGKTQLVMSLGSVLNIDVERIMMTNYSMPGQTLELKRRIAEVMQKGAVRILFIDEIEKAHPAVQKDLLDILDRGQFSVSMVDANGTVVNAVEVNVRNAHVYFATNAGASYLESLSSRNKINLDELKVRMVQDGLDKYLLDRLDGVIPFFNLYKSEYRGVVIREIRSILKDFRVNNPDSTIELLNLRGFIEKVVDETYSTKMSNRTALSALSADLRTRISAFMRDNRIFEGGEVKLELPGKAGRLKSLSCDTLLRSSP